MSDKSVKPKSRLGRGLSSLISLSAPDEAPTQLPAIPHSTATSALPSDAASAAAPSAGPAPAAASPAAAAPAEAAAPVAAPAEHAEVALDQETFERVLAELLEQGTDRRVAEGRARRAAMVAARNKAEGGS